MRRPKTGDSKLDKKRAKVPKANASAGVISPACRMSSSGIPSGGYSTVLRSYLGFCLYKSALRLRGMLDDAFLDYGLITPQFGILSVLVASGPLSQIEIGQHVTIDKATMVKLIDSLEALGFVKRTPHAQDRRVRIVELTAKGTSTFQKLIETARNVESTFAKNLNVDERATLQKLTSKLLDE